MAADMIDAAASALSTMVDPWRMLLLLIGVIVGLTVGVIPGLGGIVGLALLIPFTYSLDPFAAFALLIGMAAVTTTSDTIPAVLFGVPGTSGSVATVRDGHPLAQQGQAARAFGAAFTASLAGGIAGAFLLALSIPVLRPIMLYIGSPELFALIVFGLSMIAVLSGNAPLRGMAIAGCGLMIAMIGAGPQTATLRWTFGSLYLRDGLPMIPVSLGLFALPELADMVIRRSKIARDAASANYSLAGQWEGMRDAIRHWWLVLRCSWLGSALGAIPGIGSAVIDWIAYGYAARTEKNTENFGKGDIRGVIAPESANNAKEGGALVPTIAFGVPGSASMALLLGAFLIHGLIPGPDMLTRNLDVTYAIIWSLAFANILGTVICLFASGQLARLAEIRYGILVPVVLAVVLVGAFQGSRNWGDLYVLLIFGAIGWLMKRFSWPRPPLILGFILGGIFERYLVISTQRYDWEWLTRPGVIIIFVLALWSLYPPLRRNFAGGIQGLLKSRPADRRIDGSACFSIGVIVTVSVALFLSKDWLFYAGIVPWITGMFTLFFAVATLVNGWLQGAGPGPDSRELPMDLAGVSGETDADGTTLTSRLIWLRAGSYFGWLAGLLALCGLIGILPAIPVFIALFMRLHGRESLWLTLPVALGTGAACWLVFDRLLAVPWPGSALGAVFPALRSLTGLL